MNKILKFLWIFLVVIFISLGMLLKSNFAADIPVVELRDKWAYDNSKFIDIEGMSVHYRINGSGYPVLLIHGTGASLHTWEKWTEILQLEFQVISVDLPGFGMTGPNKSGKYSLAYYADFLDTFLSKLGVDSLAIAGNSLGGAIAWTYTTMFPAKVKKLILIDASGYPSDKEPPLAFKLAKNPITKTLLKNITPKSLLESSIKEVYFDQSFVTEKLINQYYEMLLREGNRQAFIDRVNGFYYDDASKIKTISCPTLIQWGRHDRWILLEDAYKFKNDIPGSKLIVYDNAGHVPMEEIPIKTGNDALKFLKSE